MRALYIAFAVVLSGCSVSSAEPVELNLDHPTSKEADIEVAEAYCTYLGDCFGSEYEYCFKVLTANSGPSRSTFTKPGLKACVEAIDLQACQTKRTLPPECSVHYSLPTY